MRRKAHYQINPLGVLFALWIAGVASLLGAQLVLALVIGFAFVPSGTIVIDAMEALDSAYQRRRARRRRAARAAK